MSTPADDEPWEPWDFKSVVEPEDLSPPPAAPPAAETSSHELEPTGYSHAKCEHPPTKAARAACRRERARIARDVAPGSA
jgi:hypothetical protein